MFFTTRLCSNITRDRGQYNFIVDAVYTEGNLWDPHFSTAEEQNRNVIVHIKDNDNEQVLNSKVVLGDDNEIVDESDLNTFIRDDYLPWYCEEQSNGICTGFGELIAFDLGLVQDLNINSDVRGFSKFFIGVKTTKGSDVSLYPLREDTGRGDVIVYSSLIEAMEAVSKYRSLEFNRMDYSKDFYVLECWKFKED